MSITGGCRCGAVRYEVESETQLPVYACHCHQCQRWSGSAFSLQALAREGALAVAGPIIVYEIGTGDSIAMQRICATCHTRIYNTNTRRPGLAIIRAGTLDQTAELDCRAHIYVAYKQDWIMLPEGGSPMARRAAARRIFCSTDEIGLGW
ncbi:GFA family protein [Sphingopyxis sp.]|uniref:GFA family protein n=1 Tax=Sphingopyxis sp. TaxID=1908224 RepID=UPI003A1026B6